LSFLILSAIIAACLLIVIGCDPANRDTFVQQYVVQGQMYVGHAPEIRLTHTVSPDEHYDPLRAGVSGANVELMAGSQTFQLIERVSDPRGNGYYGLAPTDTHTVTPGVHYSLLAAIGTDTITAQTTAAGFMNFTQPASDSDTTVIAFGAEEFTMRWPQETHLNRGYWAIFENLNPHHGDDSCWLSGNAAGPDKRIGQWNSYWNEPPTADSVNTPWILFGWDGLYRVRVFACDTALWFWSSTWVPANPENCPITNVQGGIGVFTAGGVDTAYFYMAKNPDIHQ
jgi:hypothetical protein